MGSEARLGPEVGALLAAMGAAVGGAAGHCTITARAVDASRRASGGGRTRPYPSGATGWHSIEVNITLTVAPDGCDRAAASPTGEVLPCEDDQHRRRPAVPGRDIRDDHSRRTARGRRPHHSPSASAGISLTGADADWTRRRRRRRTDGGDSDGTDGGDSTARMAGRRRHHGTDGDGTDGTDGDGTDNTDGDGTDGGDADGTDGTDGDGTDA